MAEQRSLAPVGGAVVKLRNSRPVEHRAWRRGTIEKLEQAVGGHDGTADGGPISPVRRALDGVGEAGDAGEARVRTVCAQDYNADAVRRQGARVRNDHLDGTR